MDVLSRIHTGKHGWVWTKRLKSSNSTSQQSHKNYAFLTQKLTCSASAMPLNAAASKLDPNSQSPQIPTRATGSKMQGTPGVFVGKPAPLENQNKTWIRIIIHDRKMKWKTNRASWTAPISWNIRETRRREKHRLVYVTGISSATSPWGRLQTIDPSTEKVSNYQSWTLVKKGVGIDPSGKPRAIPTPWSISLRTLSAFTAGMLSCIHTSKSHYINVSLRQGTFQAHLTAP